MSICYINEEYIKYWILVNGARMLLSYFKKNEYSSCKVVLTLEIV